MRMSTSKILNALVDAGILTGWNRIRLTDWRGFPETYHEVQFKNEHLFNLDNEIYGKDARLYFYCANPTVANTIKDILKRLKVTVNENWGRPNLSRFEVPVTYFKGNRWWE